jgi:hypothetical protein
MMKKWMYYFCLITAVCVTTRPSWAQDKTQEKPKTEERAKPSVPVRVQIVFTEYDGEKKVSSMPYTFMVIADERMGGYYSTSLRTGIRVPIEVDGKDQKTTYMDLGSNIDCGVRSEDDGRYRVYLSFERSSLFPNKSAEGERLVSEPNGLPLLRQFRSSESLVLKDGQALENIASTDPLNGHSLHVSVTINVQK